MSIDFSKLFTFCITFMQLPLVFKEGTYLIEMKENVVGEMQAFILKRENNLPSWRGQVLN